MNPLPRGLYGIADATYGDPVALGTALHEAGCQVIQLRTKGWPKHEVLAAASALRSVCTRSKLIINDHVDVAAQSQADGVHLGQEDSDPTEARRILGSAALIGLSTHSLAQVRAATAVDYIGFGPVYRTMTKVQAEQQVGTDLLKQAVKISPIPVVAIGGINASNLQNVQDTGVHSWAAVRAILCAEPIEAGVLQMSVHP